MDARGCFDAIIFFCLGALIAISLLLLSACGDARPVIAPPVEVRTVRVNVPVPAPCIDVGQIPSLVFKGLPLTGDAAHDADLIAAQDLALRKALETSLALLGACVR